MVEPKFAIARSEDALMLPWWIMERDNTLGRVLYNVLEPTHEMWLATVDPSHTHLVNVFLGDEAVGASWVGYRYGNAAQIHFVVARDHFHQSHELGMAAIDFWKRSLGPCRPQCFWGWTPAVFRDVLRTIRGWGFRQVARIPGGCAIPSESKPHRVCDAIVSVLTFNDAQEA